MTDGQARARGIEHDTLLPADDFKIQTNSLELSYNAARALGVPAGEIFACLLRDDLSPPKLRTRPHRATVEALRRLVLDIGSRAAAGDALLFVAVNHGIKGVGLATGDPPVDELDDLDEARPSEPLTPARLDECLRPLTGPQVLIVSACYSGQFLPLGARANRMVLTACRADEPYLVRRHDCAWPAFLDELFGAWCMEALSDAIPRTALPLPDAFARAAQRLGEVSAGDVPLCEGIAHWPR